MAKRELKSKKVSSNETITKESQDLYVCVHDIINKRKSLLQALKITLVAQEESELVNNVRSQRYLEIENIKKELAKVNALYQKLQKLFPNVKGIMTHAEKEINYLHNQIQVLSNTNKANGKELEMLEKMNDSLVDIRKEEIKEEKKELRKMTNSLKPKTHKPKKKVEEKPQLSKLDRIKNNLSIIEDKLKDL